MHLVLFSCIGFWKVGPCGCFASFLSTKCMNNWIVECHRKISYFCVFPLNQNSPKGSIHYKKIHFRDVRVCHSWSLFCHACTSMTILWQNQDSHTCAVIEVFHDITKIIITEVSTSMTINRASEKCFRQGWPTRGIHRNGMPLSYRVRVWIR